VNIVEEESNSHGMPPPPTPQRETNYGNMPLAVSQTGGGGGGGGPPSKVEENGKKFGKKLGNAGTLYFWFYLYIYFLCLCGCLTGSQLSLGLERRLARTL